MKIDAEKVTEKKKRNREKQKKKNINKNNGYDWRWVVVDVVIDLKTGIWYSYVSHNATRASERDKTIERERKRSK